MNLSITFLVLMLCVLVLNLIMFCSAKTCMQKLVLLCRSVMRDSLLMYTLCDDKYISRVGHYSVMVKCMILYTLAM